MRPGVLDIQIALHYWGSTVDYPHLETAAAKRSVEKLLRAGVIEEGPGGGYRKTAALQDWVHALTRVPFPVIE